MNIWRDVKATSCQRNTNKTGVDTIISSTQAEKKHLYTVKLCSEIKLNPGAH